MPKKKQPGSARKKAAAQRERMGQRRASACPGLKEPVPSGEKSNNGSKEPFSSDRKEKSLVSIECHCSIGGLSTLYESWQSNPPWSDSPTQGVCTSPRVPLTHVSAGQVKLTSGRQRKNNSRNTEILAGKNTETQTAKQIEILTEKQTESNVEKQIETLVWKQTEPFAGRKTRTGNRTETLARNKTETTNGIKTKNPTLKRAETQTGKKNEYIQQQKSIPKQTKIQLKSAEINTKNPENETNKKENTFQKRNETIIENQTVTTTKTMKSKVRESKTQRKKTKNVSEKQTRGITDKEAEPFKKHTDHIIEKQTEIKHCENSHKMQDDAQLMKKDKGTELKNKQGKIKAKKGQSLEKLTQAQINEKNDHQKVHSKKALETNHDIFPQDYFTEYVNINKQLIEKNFLYSIQGNFHQASEGYFSTNAGKQCVANSLSALLYTKSKAIEMWNAHDLDNILIAGNDLYTGLQRCAHITHDYLLITDLPATGVELNGNIHNYDLKIPIAGLVSREQTNTDSELTVNLHDGIKEAFEISNTCFLTFCGNTNALMKTDSYFFLFDPHARNHTGMVSSEGKSVLVCFKTVSGVVEHCCCVAEQLTAETHIQFEITPLTKDDGLMGPKHHNLFSNRMNKQIMEIDDTASAATFDKQNSVYIAHVEKEVFSFVPLTSSDKLQLCYMCNIQYIPVEQRNKTVSKPLKVPTETKEISKDGNCFFRAISWLLSNSEKYHKELRCLTVDHMIRHAEQLKSYLPQTFSHVSDYVLSTDMEMSKTWATEVEIKAIADMLGINIFVFSNGKWIRTTPFESVVYTGAIFLKHVNNNHYDVVLNTSGYFHKGTPADENGKIEPLCESKNLRSKLCENAKKSIWLADKRLAEKRKIGSSEKSTKNNIEDTTANRIERYMLDQKRKDVKIQENKNKKTKLNENMELQHSARKRKLTNAQRQQIHRKLKCQDEKEALKQKDALRKRLKRKNMSVEEYEVLKQKNATGMQKIRKNMSVEEYKVVKKKRTAGMQEIRKSMPAEEYEIVKMKHTAGMQEIRKNMPAEEYEVVKKKRTAGMQKIRKSMPAEEYEIVKMKHTAGMQEIRKNMPAEEYEVVKKKRSAGMQKIRKSMPAEEYEIVKMKHTALMQEIRKNMPAEEYEVVKKKRTAGMQKNRKNMPAEKYEIVKKKHTAGMQEIRKHMPAEEYEVVKKKRTAGMQEIRKNMPAEKYEIVKMKHTVGMQEIRKNMPVEEYEVVKKKRTTEMQEIRKNMSVDEVNIKKKENATKKRETRHVKKVKQDELNKAYLSGESLEAGNIVLQEFFKLIREGPVFNCVCCNRFLYRRDVQHFTKSIADKCEKVLSIHLSNADVTKGKEKDTWICKDICGKQIKEGNMPSISISNNLRVDEVPPELKDLCSLEKQLISKVIPFMKILALPAGSQHGLKGQVVLVPSNTDKTAAALPRNTTESEIVALQLKRRLSDKYGTSKQYIRPSKVNGAIAILKSINSNYFNVPVNEDWDKQIETDADNINLMQALSENPNSESAYTVTNGHEDISDSTDVIDDLQQKNKNCGTSDDKPDSSCSQEHMNVINEQTQLRKHVQDKNAFTGNKFDEQITDSEDEVDKDNTSEVVDDLQLRRSLNSTTCMYPEYGPSVSTDKIINIAPGEGQTPVSIFVQKNWETLAFPSLFPTGKNTFDHERPIRITPKKYVISRLTGKDHRFAESPEYTFQCLHWIESNSVSDTITISLKKARSTDLTVGHLQNTDFLTSMFKEDEIFASFKKVRGTPQYWKEMQQDMLAKIKHFGNYTFFLSCSAADFHWPELIQIVAQQYGESYTIEHIEKDMTKKTKRNWLARNPVTVARHIDYIFRKLWGSVILSGIHPIGQILNYDIRKEMQSRGTAHFHSAIHIKNAPQIDRSSDEEVIAFVDKYITCSIPNDNEKLKDLVVSRQVHHHTHSCKKKKNVNCRYHYPKPPCNVTTIARKPESVNAKRLIEQARLILQQVMETLEHTDTNITLRELLAASGVTEAQYTFAITSCLKKTSVMLKRNPVEQCVNPYNATILKALRANMDIQFITDVWACVAYITSYMCKPERTMSDLMKVACKEAGTVRDKLKKIGSTFLKSREVSQHEAVARLLGLPLKESNTQVMFIPTGYNHQRTRMLKPRTVLETMDKDATDIYMSNILDRYAARPKALHKLCLAEFASNYSPYYKKKKETENSEHYNENENESDKEDEEAEDYFTEVIQLNNGLGTMKKRSRPLVLRDYHVSKKRDSEKYYHRLLLLYLPWKQECDLNQEETYENMYLKNKDYMQENVTHFEPYLEEVETAADAYDENDCQNEIWDDMAPAAEQARNVDVDVDPNFQLLDTDNLTPEQIKDVEQTTIHNPIGKQLNTVLHATIQPDSEYLTMARSLNRKQRAIHDYILKWCRQMKTCSKNEEPDPFYIFLSGGAGVGKSHVVHTVYQTALRNLRQEGQNPDSTTILLTAPTGKAAINIGGTTLHSAFQLQCRRRGEIEKNHKYVRPSASKLNSMRAKYSNLKILVIDEISMVANTLFSDLDLTLQDIFENDQLFGGVSVLTVGDLLQLNPVGSYPVYRPFKGNYMSLAPSAWDSFKLYELTEVIRQKGDPEFVELLSRIRIGDNTDLDTETIKNLQYNSLPDDCVSVFFSNKLTDKYNENQLSYLPGEIYKIKASDSKKDITTRRVAVTVTSTLIHETGGLASEVNLAVNARYMHVKNTDINEGLVNGVTGTIKVLELPRENPLAGTIYVKFDDEKVGQNLKLSSKYRDLVPIKAVTVMFTITEKSSSIKVERTQYPGTLAWGITVHKAQGSTYTEMVADLTYTEKQKNTQPGQVYTMLSRAKSMDRLKVINFEKQKVVVNQSALNEMKRLRSENTLQLELQGTEDLFSVSFLNVRHLNPHYKDVQMDPPLKSSDIICLSETCTTDYTVYALEGMSICSEPTVHGSVVYYSNRCENVEQIKRTLNTIETVIVKMKDITLISVYIPPATSYSNAVKDFEECLQIMNSTSNNCIMAGDFNMNLHNRLKLEEKARQYGLRQLVEDSTHNRGSVLDLVFTNICDISVKSIPVYFSDHNILKITLNDRLFHA